MIRSSHHLARTHLLSLTLDELTGTLDDLGQKAFRARQVAQWVYEHGVQTFDDMTNLSKPLRESLAGRFDIYRSKVIRRAASSDGTVKLLLEWPDGATSECVMIPADRQKTACLSSQVGCPVGCRFCASGLDGLQRNLTPGEIVEQALRVRAEAACNGGRLTNVVFMGLGEPLANYETVMQSVRTINSSWGLAIGARKITISTVGLPKQIRKLADEGLQLNLALSLHAPTDDLRGALIPWAERISIEQLVEACRYYFDRTGREITLEYTLLRGTNDLPEHARELAHFVKKLRCNVNLLRYNPVETLPYRRPTSEASHAFQQALRQHGVNSHIRKSRGLDIEAACGQLRYAEMNRGIERKSQSLPVRKIEIKAPHSC
ncbi:MAG: 23S rRNA (adenine(2503)-C(2))-methyltransferase RlmN [Phycisphaerales bacterium]|nr:23S rRNA (adenine(2503)-C(2))-methyltransferase RlmN [Phycisphaerales bacterium]